MTDTSDNTDGTWPRVVVCRGCCCGSPDKHPEADHDGQVAAISAVARTRIVDCLDECLYSNVVVVRPGPGRSVWLGRLTSTIVTEELCEWLDAGSPEPLPPILDVYAFSPRART